MSPWGYVDHPPFSIAVLAAWKALFGDSLLSLRVLPALASGAEVTLHMSSYPFYPPAVTRSIS